jgi:hypothetical protein
MGACIIVTSMMMDYYQKRQTTQEEGSADGASFWSEQVMCLAGIHGPRSERVLARACASPLHVRSRMHGSNHALPRRALVPHARKRVCVCARRSCRSPAFSCSIICSPLEGFESRSSRLGTGAREGGRVGDHTPRGLEQGCGRGWKLPPDLFP